MIVADEAFGQAENLMHPYSGHRLNNKLPSELVGCIFVVCTSNLRILLFTIHLDMENMIRVVIACCILHNFVMEWVRMLSDHVPQNAAQDVQLINLEASAAWPTIFHPAPSVFQSKDVGSRATY